MTERSPSRSGCRQPAAGQPDPPTDRWAGHPARAGRHREGEQGAGFGKPWCGSCPDWQDSEPASLTRGKAPVRHIPIKLLHGSAVRPRRSCGNAAAWPRPSHSSESVKAGPPAGQWWRRVGVCRRAEVRQLETVGLIKPRHGSSESAGWADSEAAAEGDGCARVCVPAIVRGCRLVRVSSRSACQSRRTHCLSEPVTRP